MDHFRIHGDNIVECERIAKIVINETKPGHTNVFLMSPSTIVFELLFNYEGEHYSWHIELLPGFNKAGRHRWESNIFDILKKNGSFLDETPDAIITSVNGSEETILCAIEFCSALQAGNQAWQRSGRAFSTGRTGCPYLYIVDFVKYELNSQTRERKALRFPNPAVPYSYINFSRNINNFVAQVYVRSEEFDKSRDLLLSGFDENDFGDHELASYLIKRMLGLDTAHEEDSILRKNLNVVLFLARSSNPATNFTPSQWQDLYSSSKDIVDYAIDNSKFNFHKTITAKGQHGKSESFLRIIDGLSIGLASRDLPFGIIPATKRHEFAVKLERLYPTYNHNVIESIGKSDKHLVLCLIKGFKPRGDDNRPDRGILPLAVMLSASDVDVMTYLYGPVFYNNYDNLINHPKKLAASNGLWKSILALSNYVALDVPILAGQISDAENLFDTSALKIYYMRIHSRDTLESDLFSSVPTEYHEDDVDTGIHYMFSWILHNHCFEGMCNPPGGDWSGFSLIIDNTEKRWLSLPRVSDDVAGKRPDHILNDVFQKPLLLLIESKERSIDLEPDVGNGLLNYVRSLLRYVPNVERQCYPTIGAWNRADVKTDANNFEMISAAAYLKDTAQSNKVVFSNSHCEMLFIMSPIEKGWDIEIVPSSSKTVLFKEYLLKNINTTEIILH